MVADAAMRLRVDFVALSVECALGPNLEARARSARRAALPAEVATGHTADDQAETVLVNLMRGSGVDGLAGMHPGRRHPLLGLRRSETHRLVTALGFKIVSDPSNHDPAFQRNRIRHELLPMAQDVSRRDLVPVLARQAALLADDAALLDELARVLDPRDARQLALAPRPLARRAVRGWLRAMHPDRYPPSSAAVERVLAVARGEVVACQLPGGCRVRRSQGRLVVESR